MTERLMAAAASIATAATHPEQPQLLTADSQAMFLFSLQMLTSDTCRVLIWQWTLSKGQWNSAIADNEGKIPLLRQQL